MSRLSFQPNAQRAQTVLRTCEELGFVLVGITAAAPSDAEDVNAMRNWLAAGKHGEMNYMTEALEKRLDVTQLLPGAKSVICVADRHADAFAEKISQEKSIGKIARYAWGDDYHWIIKKRLHRLADLLKTMWPEEKFRSSVDTAPVLEREHAQRAGLGWIGKNTMLLHPQLGSYIMLGQIITTLSLQSRADVGLPMLEDHCGSCTRCLDTCPTQCLTPRTMDATRCISYLTLEHRSEIDEALHPMMGQWIAGCDVCQEVCPFNQKEVTQASHVGYTPRPPAPGIALLDLLNWSEEDRQLAFVKSALKRVKLPQLKRNALIAAGNVLAEKFDAAMFDRITQIAEDENETELVRHTAKQILARLNK